MSRVRGGRVLARWLTPSVALLLAACAATDTPPPSPVQDAASPFTDCAPLTVPPAGGRGAGLSAAPAASEGSPAGARGADLPEVSLPCFTGGQSFDLRALRGPAVVNLWASSCAPCREELPLLQELADRTAGRLHVVGVDTFDSRAAGASFAADKGVTFPTFFDPEKKLLTALGKVNLPVTVFVGADGGRYVYAGKALDKPTLGGLVRAHSGVTVVE